MKLLPQTLKKSLNKAYLKEKVNRADIEVFKKNLNTLLSKIDEEEFEEHLKNVISAFLKETWYKDQYEINTKNRKDLVIHNGKSTKEPVGVILEVKKPSNKAEMISIAKPNAKAMHELILYYLQERILGNINIKHLIVTNIYEWFIIDEVWFEKNVYRNNKLIKDYENYKLSGKDTKFFYESIAKPFLDSLNEDIPCTYFDIRDYEKIVQNNDKKDDNKLIALYKILSPAHLLKQPFANDSNSLDTKFYTELLHIIGLEEIKDGSKKLIKQKEKPESASLLENTIIKLEDKDCLRNISNLTSFGTTKKEQLFNIALELCITWVNRILFLKLLEAQLSKYHKEDKDYLFLNTQSIFDFDELSNLFFQVLAEKQNNRRDHLKAKFSKVPYLNSSLFERTELERQAFDISALDNRLELSLYSTTVFKNEQGNRRSGKLPVLQYLFEFLNAYDFNSEGAEEIQEENKGLINASVLGLIFEKINGYKDGSFFTPGFITMYMCRETIRRSVVQKFNDTKGWSCNNIDELYNKIENKKEANEIINDIKICDPAVGSGHFLVSALNEIIAIKSELKILLDSENKTLRDYHIEVVNDELIVMDDDGKFFEYNPKNKENQRVQEVLFHEKEIIIENCLFGVDINPNSVKICRLRLWIELLKNSYYTQGSNYIELETLPNIDINIKCGNSLISRFALDADLSPALKKSNFTIAAYRSAVQTYRQARSKEEKREMESLITSIKNDFQIGIGRESKQYKELTNLESKYFKLYGGKLFNQKITKKEIEARSEMSEMIEKKKIEIEEIKNNKIYENAFEWRFEFPEVLNDEGDFIGFDIVIGNPPYGVKLDENRIEFYKSKYECIVGHTEIYYLFIELALKSLLKKANLLSFIIPNAWLTNKYAKGIRRIVLTEFDIKEIINFNKQIIFEDAQVETSILLVYKSSPQQDLLVANSIEIPGVLFNKANWLKDENFIINFSENPIVQSVLDKVNIQKNKFEDYLDISNGCKPYQAGYGINIQGEKLTKEDVENRIYHSPIKLDDSYLPELKGKNIGKYSLKKGKDFIKWGAWLMSPKDGKYFFNDKILIRQIIGDTLIATIDKDKNIADQTLYTCILYEEDNINHLEFFLTIVNSKLYGFYFRKYYSEEDDLFPKIKVNELKRLPIKEVLPETQIEFANKANNILTIKSENIEADTSVLEKEIDEMVYKLYNLTDEEIKIVENK